MEMTYEAAEEILQKRFAEFPEAKALTEDPAFKTTLKKMLEFEGVDASLFPIIENEVLVTLAFYTPLSQLAENIAESTGLTLEVAKKLVTMIESILLAPVMDDLLTFDTIWNSEPENNTTLPEADKNMKEKLELRPQTQGEGTGPVATNNGGSDVRPLTREEVLRSIAPSRTMAKDIASMTAHSTPQTQSSTNNTGASVQK